MSQSETADEWKWNKLEWIAAQSASSRSIMIFKPNRSLFTYQMPTSDSPLSIQGGTLHNRSNLTDEVSSSSIILTPFEYLFYFHRAD